MTAGMRGKLSCDEVQLARPWARLWCTLGVRGVWASIVIRTIGVMTLGGIPAKQRAHKERRLFRITVMIVPATPLVRATGAGAYAAASQVGGQTDRVRVGRRPGGGWGGGGGVSGQLRVAAHSFGGELPAVVQQEAARDENDGTREGERDGQRSGRRRIVGRRNQWPSSAAAADTGGQRCGRVRRCTRDSAAGVRLRWGNRVRVSGTV